MEGPTSNPRIREAGKKDLELSLGYRAKPYHKKIKTGRLGRQLSLSHANSQDPCVKEARCRAPVRRWAEHRSTPRVHGSGSLALIADNDTTSLLKQVQECPLLHKHAMVRMPLHSRTPKMRTCRQTHKIFKNLKQEKGRRSKAKNSTNF